ncbi:MAG: ABC transporter permease, partial [Lewinellaceae bacterium]|nr:ABC transporter permease [Lewinellaceae bacterium]
MIRNHLKIALRALRKNKIYTAVTLIGLTVGIAAALLIFRMVRYELSFNKNFANYDRIVRVVSVVSTAEEGESYTACTPIPAMAVMKEQVSQFEAMARVKEFWGTLSLPNPNGGAPLKKFNTEDGETAFFVEPEFFKVFQLDWLAGDPATALAEPNSIVLTERWARKYFDDPRQAIGQEMTIDNLIPVVVKGVVAGLPVNCDFPIPFLGSYATVKAYPDYLFYDETAWGSCSSNNQVYALLRNPGQMDAAQRVLAGVGAEEYKSRNGRKSRKHILQPLSELHFDERYGHSGTHQVSKSRLRILSGIGILILVMACFNFINLATAQSALRAKEVGVRKTLGGQRLQLAGQFLSETGIIVVLAILLGANLAALCSPLLKYVSDVPGDMPFLTNPAVWGFLAVLAVLVTLLAGLYPSLALASYRPIIALRSQSVQGKHGNVSLRKSLVILQFVIAQALIIGAIITLMQLDYIRSRDLGFSKDLVYTFGIGIDSASIARQTALKQELLQIPTVSTVSFSSDQPMSGNTWASNFRYGTRPEDEAYAITLKFCDEDYQEAYGLKLLAGKWYPPSDTIRNGVVNMTLLRKLGIAAPEEVVGQYLTMGNRKIQITGVAEDFHTHSLHQEHLPLLMAPRKDYYWETGVKIRPGNISKTLAAVQQAYDKVLPEQVFDGGFLDERIAAFYEDDSRL